MKSIKFSTINFLKLQNTTSKKKAKAVRDEASDLFKSQSLSTCKTLLVKGGTVGADLQGI